MKSPEYWAKRFEILNESMLSRGEEFEATTRREYAKAQAAIRKEVNAFYQRFAKNNEGMSLADARQTLRKGELAEFKWSVEDYIKRGRENAVDQRWMRELENASIRVRVSRLEALQLQMRQHIEELFGRRQAGTSRLLRGIYKDGYYRSVFELQKGIGLGTSFAKLDKTQIEKLLSTPWAPDGSNFSARIWRDRTKLVSELQTTLTQGLIRGTSADQLIGEFSLRMNVSISDAKRIILTESAYFANQASLDGFKALGVENFRYVATLDSRTSFKCREMDGKVFKLEEAQPGVNVPPLHAHCRSVTIPHFEDNVQERAGEGPNGEVKMFPGNTNYKDWTEGNVPPDKPDTPAAAVPAVTAPPSGPAATVPAVPSPRDFQPGTVLDEPTPGGVKLPAYNPRASYYTQLPGAPQEVAEKLSDVNREIVRAGSAADKQTTVLLDAVTGAERSRASVNMRTGPTAADLPARIKDTLAASAAPRSIISTRNAKPTGRAGTGDLLSLLLLAALAAAVVASQDGGTGYISRGESSLTEEEFAERVDRYSEEIRKQLVGDREYSALPAAAQAEYLDHLVMRRIVDELGWQYAEDFEATPRR